MANLTIKPKFLIIKFGTTIVEKETSMPLAFRPESFYKEDVISEQNVG